MNLDLKKIDILCKGNPPLIQVACSHSDNSIVTRTGCVSTITDTALILKPHDEKDIAQNVIGKFVIIPINVIKEIIIIK